MKVHGACHCGKITYEAEVNPASTTLCHCTDCQTMSGAPFRAIVVAPADGFVMKTGQVKTYVKTAESGNKRVQAFCGDCATPIYSAPPENVTAYFLRLGALRERAELVPQKQIWHRSSLPWALDVTGFQTREKH